MRMDSKLEISLLYDFYSELLNASQQQVIELYVNDDLSLAEAADILDISRQGVRDSLNRASKKLRDYERKLGLVKAYRERQALSEKITREAQAVIGVTDNEDIIRRCRSIIEYTDKLTEKEDQHGI